MTCAGHYDYRCYARGCGEDASTLSMLAGVALGFAFVYFYGDAVVAHCRRSQLAF